MNDPNRTNRRTIEYRGAQEDRACQSPVRLRVNRSQSDKTEAAACASSHRTVRERAGRLSHSPEPLLAREGTLFILHYTRRHYEGCAVCVSRARVCVSARVDIGVYASCIRAIPTKGEGRGERRRRPPHRGEWWRKGWRHYVRPGCDGKGMEERREMPKSRGLSANGKKRDGTRANEREIVDARYPLHTMRVSFSSGRQVFFEI